MVYSNNLNFEVSLPIPTTIKYYCSAVCCCRYFFPTYENDNLLCQLDDDDGNHGSEDVIGEDMLTPDTILAEGALRRELLQS